MEKRLISLSVVGICILLVGGTLLFFHGLNKSMLKQEFYYDTLFVQTPTSQNTVPSVIKTSLLKRSPIQEKQESSNVKVEKALKRGMQILETRLLEQGFSEVKVAFYIGRWNIVLNLQLELMKVKAKKEGKTLGDLLNVNQEVSPREEEKIEQGISWLLYCVVYGNPNGILDAKVMFSGVIALGLQCQ